MFPFALSLSLLKKTPPPKSPLSGELRISLTRSSLSKSYQWMSKIKKLLEIPSPRLNKKWAIKSELTPRVKKLLLIYHKSFSKLARAENSTMLISSIENLEHLLLPIIICKTINI